MMSITMYLKYSFCSKLSRIRSLNMYLLSSCNAELAFHHIFLVILCENDNSNTRCTEVIVASSVRQLDSSSCFIYSSLSTFSCFNNKSNKTISFYVFHSILPMKTSLKLYFRTLLMQGHLLSFSIRTDDSSHILLQVQLDQ